MEAITITLTELPFDHEGMIIGFDGNIAEKQRIREMGFIPGDPVFVVARVNKSLIVRTRDVRIAISDEVASGIIIEERRRNAISMRHTRRHNCRNRRHARQDA